MALFLSPPLSPLSLQDRRVWVVYEGRRLRATKLRERGLEEGKREHKNLILGLKLAPSSFVFGRTAGPLVHLSHPVNDNNFQPTTLSLVTN